MAHRALAGGTIHPPATLDGGELANLDDDGSQASRLRMHVQGVSARSRAKPESLRRDASLRTGNRGRAGRAYRRSRSRISSAKSWDLQVRTVANRPHLARSDHGQVSFRLLDRADSSLRADWVRVGRTR